MMFLMPMAASIVRMTISRNREFMGMGGSIKQLFSTHPTTEQRIERLEALK